MPAGRRINLTLPDPRRITDILDGIPGAFEGMLQAREQVKAGDVIPLDEL